MALVCRRVLFAKESGELFPMKTKLCSCIWLVEFLIKRLGIYCLRKQNYHGLEYVIENASFEVTHCMLSMSVL